MWVHLPVKWLQILLRIASNFAVDKISVVNEKDSNYHFLITRHGEC